ncbi:RhoGEF domain-containing protein [Heterostelium album PN500]|uniref:RhoGEF domain-containing protein n=1 Tax=Heterostelium pallidum (strain ATCC 26659 / Pp 5 / PN500) TaxID=670386 RepID=D3B5F0_HETP5|nr:RhoGEF domain-containing protein [Heterostelium album PN500]EFA83098.1 RhoGEF domain-containing protein [Heterostelium album PN500]|eukprot:XP_020435215.1 RhoGEF domain-containing protein [Heterostelium album PN500]
MQKIIANIFDKSIIHTTYIVRKIKYRKFIIREIINFEQTYINKLNLLVENLKKPLIEDEFYRGIISIDKVNQLFSNIEEILELHRKILSTFSKPPPHLIGKIYIEYLPLFSTYLPYVKNYNNAFKIYSSLVDNETFSELISLFGYLPSYLILPIQQTPRYVLLFSDLLKNTNPQNEDYDNLGKLLEMVRTTASNINQCITSQESEADEEEQVANNTGVASSPKRPASASSKRKPRNSISMHKKAIDAVLSNSDNFHDNYSNVPSYLRPTIASSGWSRSKVTEPQSPLPRWKYTTHIDHNQLYNIPPSPSSLLNNTASPLPSPSKPTIVTPTKQWQRPSTPSQRYHDVHKMTKAFPHRPPSPLPKPNFYGTFPLNSCSTTPTSSSNSESATSSPTSSTPIKLTKSNKTISSGSLTTITSTTFSNQSPATTTSPATTPRGNDTSSITIEISSST